MHLKNHIEALIFTAEHSITLDEIKSCLQSAFGWELVDEDIKKEIELIAEKYRNEDFSFELIEIAGGYQFLTKKEFYPAVQVLLAQKAKKKLSTAALETLSIIAYRQPVTKAEIEHIRGVNSDYSIHKLLEKELVEISGKSEGPGKPVLYSTTKLFMDFFGIKSPKDLPQLKDIRLEENEIGQPQE